MDIHPFSPRKVLFDCPCCDVRAVWRTDYSPDAAMDPDRWKKRSTTFPGIAAAMAAQWGAGL